MSIGPSRLIHVDDTSLLISYQGPWAGGDTYPVTTTRSGSPFDDTLHSLSGSGSFTFNFTGSSVSVIGIFLSSTLPSWTCLIDGYTKPTPSNLTVVASGTKDSPFLFDYIQYVPVASTILDNATVVVDAFDSQIQYDSGWNNLGTTGMQMSVQDASMTFDFVGIQIAWITTVAFNANTTVNSSTQCSIDNGTFFPFQVAGHNSTVQIYDLVSFQTPALSPGPHSLSVRYGPANDSSAPLVLGNLIFRISPFRPSSQPLRALQEALQVLQATEALEPLQALKPITVHDCHWFLDWYASYANYGDGQR